MSFGKIKKPSFKKTPTLPDSNTKLTALQAKKANAFIHKVSIIWHEKIKPFFLVMSSLGWTPQKTIKERMTNQATPTTTHTPPKKTNSTSHKNDSQHTEPENPDNGEKHSDTVKKNGATTCKTSKPEAKKPSDMTDQMTRSRKLFINELQTEVKSGKTPHETAKKLAKLCPLCEVGSQSELVTFLEDMIKIRPDVLCIALREGCTIDFYPLDNDKKDNICHNFSFDSLDSTKDSNFETISKRLNLPKIISKEMKKLRGIRKLKTSDSFKIVDFKSIQGNQYQLYNGSDSEVAKVTLYGMAHSSRVVDGQKFHKFNGISALFSVPAHEDLSDQIDKTDILVQVKRLHLPTKRSLSFQRTLMQEGGA
ncbi:hypothetical protein [Kistimonas asteriae]|uniref:hypothetical protein n=1 Tax=Kistimonas asteriae TaxID=517724 RepID=UPI001BAB2622|nr:hypothetical protein [Kistimonas asteriae]